MTSQYFLAIKRRSDADIFSNLGCVPASNPFLSLPIPAIVLDVPGLLQLSFAYVCVSI
jgi:hypothetical protein